MTTEHAHFDPRYLEELLDKHDRGTLAPDEADTLVELLNADPEQVPLTAHLMERLDEVVFDLALEQGLIAPQSHIEPLNAQEQQRAFAGIMEALADPPPAHTPHWAQRLRAFFSVPRLVGASLAGAGALALLFFILPSTPPASSPLQLSAMPPWRAKGGLHFFQSELLKATQQAGNWQFIPAGNEAATSDRLVVRYRSDRSGYLTLLRIGSQDSEQLLPLNQDDGYRINSGTHVLAADDTPLAIPLHDLKDSQAFVSLLSTRRLSKAEAAEVARYILRSGHSPALQQELAEQGILYTVTSVDVASGS